MVTTGRIVEFLIAWLVSALTIYIAVKIFPGRQKREDIGSALLTALLGEIVYTFFAIINVPLGGIVAFIIWLWILRKIFDVGWISAAIIAFLIWALSSLVGLLGLPKLL